jgi:iron transport multicopper oxidase
LINGVGTFSGGPAVPPPRINVTEGKRYRFRLISLSASGKPAGYVALAVLMLCWREGFFEFGIANHSMTVIEADGRLSLAFGI